MAGWPHGGVSMATDETRPITLPLLNPSACAVQHDAYVHLSLLFGPSSAVPQWDSVALCVAAYIPVPGEL